MALRLLVGDDQEYPPSAIVPLFRRKDGAQVAAAMPNFDELGLMPPAPLVAPEATAPVDVSSGDSRRDGEEQDEEHDSEAASDGMGETSPLRKANILRTLPYNDEADTRRGGEDPPVIPKKDRSGLISRGSTPAPVLPEASSNPSGAPCSAVGPPEAEPRKRLSGFKLGRSPWDLATADQ